MNAAEIRNPIIDIIKGIGIIMMVCGHCGSPITSYVSLFHMAIFFIASGYCFNEVNSSDNKHLVKFILKKIKNLWLSYVLWTLIFSLLHNYFITINIYTDNPRFLEECGGSIRHLDYPWSYDTIAHNFLKSLFMLGNTTRMGGAFWFLNTLFYLSIIYCIIDYLLTRFFDKRHHSLLQFSVSIILLAIGFYFSVNNIFFWGFNRVCSYYILFYLGHLMSRYRLEERLSLILPRSITLILSCGLLFAFTYFGTFALNENRYINPVLLCTASVTGWLFVYELSYMLMKTRMLRRIVIIIGQNTLSVVILHFLCFKIVNLIGVTLYDRPSYLIAAFPYLLKGGLWWVVYLFVGITIPVCLSLLWRRLKSFVYSRLCTDG